MSRSRRRRSYWSLIIILPLITIVAFLLYERFFPKRQIPTGTWSRTEDMTAVTDDAMYSWLSTGEHGIEDPYSDSYESVTLKLVLTVDQDGNYEQTVDKDSYDLAVQTAYNNMNKALMELISARFVSVGMADETGLSEEETEALIREAVGMSSEEYLKTVVPDIMPSYEDCVRTFEFTGTCDDTELFDEGRLLIGDHVYERVPDDM